MGNLSHRVWEHECLLSFLLHLFICVLTTRLLFWLLMNYCTLLNYKTRDEHEYAAGMWSWRFCFVFASRVAFLLLSFFKQSSLSLVVLAKMTSVKDKKSFTDLSCHLRTEVVTQRRHVFLNLKRSPVVDGDSRLYCHHHSFWEQDSRGLKK